MTLYDIKWFKMGLNAIENIEDGEITVANRLKIRRYPVDCQTHSDRGMYTLCSEVLDITQADNYKGTVCIVHGMAQSSDNFFETAFHYALNGFCVYMIDLEGFGLCSGKRVFGLTIEGFHHQVTALI